MLGIEPRSSARTASNHLSSPLMAYFIQLLLCLDFSPFKSAKLESEEISQWLKLLPDFDEDPSSYPSTLPIE